MLPPSATPTSSAARPPAGAQQQWWRQLRTRTSQQHYKALVTLKHAKHYNAASLPCSHGLQTRGSSAHGPPQIYARFHPPALSTSTQHLTCMHQNHSAALHAAMTVAMCMPTP